MSAVGGLPCGGVQDGLSAALLVMALGLNSVTGQLRPDYSDLQGKYCETRPQGSRCCRDRKDECGVGILGTVCYCDQFCDRGLRGDCCPDFFGLCLNETNTDNSTKDCVYKDRTLRYGEIVMDNCNPCTCAGPASHPVVTCGTETCLVDPALLARLERHADWLGWSAANHSRFWGRSLPSGLLQLLGTDRPDRRTLAQTFPIVKALEGVRLPATFDARRRPDWDGLIGAVQDQGRCGASWAVSTAGTASDRLSIQTGSRVMMSSQHLLDCVPASADTRGCRGGRLDRAWNHVRWRGVVSAECRHFRSGQTGRSRAGCRRGSGVTNSSSPSSHRCRRLYKMQPPYRVASKEKDIRHEIFTNGPVQALLRVEPDFFLYRSGVYRTSGWGERRAAYHSVRILGWGEMATGSGATLPYWVVANSWGTGWGERGLFRIWRGTNEADIETFVVGAWARTRRESDAKLQETADEYHKSHRTPSEEEEDQRGLPEDKERDAVQNEHVEASGEDPANLATASEDDGTDFQATTIADKTDSSVTSDEGEDEQLKTDKEEEMDDLFAVDDTTAENRPKFDTNQIDEEETPDKDGTDPAWKPDDEEATGSTVTPEQTKTSDKVTPDDEETVQLVTPDAGRADASPGQPVTDDTRPTGSDAVVPTVPTVETEESTDEHVHGKEEHGGLTATSKPDESQNLTPVPVTEKVEQKTTPAAKESGWFAWLPAWTTGSGNNATAAVN